MQNRTSDTICTCRTMSAEHASNCPRNTHLKNTSQDTDNIEPDSNNTSIPQTSSHAEEQPKDKGITENTPTPESKAGGHSETQQLDQPTSLSKSPVSESSVSKSSVSKSPVSKSSVSESPVSESSVSESPVSESSVSESPVSESSVTDTFLNAIASKSSSSETISTPTNKKPVDDIKQTPTLTTPELTFDVTKYIIGCANILPEATYVICQTLNDFNDPQTNFNYKNDNYASGFLPDYILKYGLALGWDTIDGVCAIFVAIDQYQKGNKKQSVLSFLNGAQLILTSWVPEIVSTLGYTTLCSSVVLAPVSFALAMFVDLIQSTIDFVEVAQEKELATWFTKKIHLVNQINAKLKITNNSPEDAKKLMAQKDDLLLEMGCRYRVNKENINTNSNLFQQLIILNQDNPQILNLDKEKTTEDKTINDSIQKNLDKRYKEQRINLGIKMLSFSGMTLGAVKSCALLFGLTAFAACPPAGIAIAAAVICTLVATCYLMKLGYMVKNDKANKQANNTFKQAKNKRYSLFTQGNTIAPANTTSAPITASNTRYAAAS